MLNSRRLNFKIFLVQKPENLGGFSPNADTESSTSASPASSSKSLQNRVMFNDTKDTRRKSTSRRGDDSSVVNSFPERTQAGDLFCAAIGGRRLPPVRETLSIRFMMLSFLGEHSRGEGHFLFVAQLLASVGNVIFPLFSQQHNWHFLLYVFFYSLSFYTLHYGFQMQSLLKFSCS